LENYVKQKVKTAAVLAVSV